MISRRVLAWLLCSTIWLGGCVNSYFTVAGDAIDEATYTSIYPWYAEFCALSEIDKKPGFGVEIVPGGAGGHSIIYLNGVCRVQDAGYPVVALCNDGGTPKPGEGVGLSVNDHYRNANWIATQGRNFVFRGDLRPGEALTKERYLQTQKTAEEMGILDGVVFHREVFKDQPAGMSKTAFMYDMSVATDYAIGFGRDRYCARVPLDRAKMAAIVKYLNQLNAPYRSGQKVFNWNVLENNCTHLAHNVLAVAGVWSEWPTDRPLLISAFDFPVPKNEFVNLMLRTNEMPITDLGALYDDTSARATMLNWHYIPTRPGGLAEAVRAIRPNEVYNTHLRLIFYDPPTPFGHYELWFNTIFSDPRYTDLRANLRHFSMLYTTTLAARRAAYSRMPERKADRGTFEAAYYDIIEREKAKLDEALRVLSAGPGQRS
ncbi:MAG: hypothetical protein ABSE20_06345 [Acetobacteraceae bacterium]|jgi:hypothetical protein